MEKISTVTELRDAISMLESRRAGEWAALKEEAHLVSENLQPGKLIQRMTRKFASSPQENELLDKSIGIATGYMAKKLVTVGSNNPLVKLLGSLVENIVANKVSQNAEGIRSIGNILLKKILGNISKDK